MELESEVRQWRIHKKDESWVLNQLRLSFGQVGLRFLMTCP
ncbi:hypothetical protein RT761_02218 [Atribacter laminatus]|jgi:hypothetical protein|uniref:Uncharacterized protein n=1 Tax=Atribacter laminatus TaxID=2847778 RepID=A0A7T1AN63_ATRLM|nr:hypothetical protein RT761_02218 [Atribacter laminatus]